METMVNLLLSMQGGSLKKELYGAGVDVTASAFVQQRHEYDSNPYVCGLRNDAFFAKGKISE